MLNAIIRQGDITIITELPKNLSELRQKLFSSGARSNPSDIKLFDDEGSIEVQVYGDRCGKILQSEVSHFYHYARREPQHLLHGFADHPAAVASAISVISFWKSNPKLTRILALVISSCMFTYDVACGSYMGIANEILTTTSAIFGILRYDIIRKKCTNNTKIY